jgi:serine phosphatase RsbU (regulator of sigma subunit)
MINSQILVRCRGLQDRAKAIVNSLSFRLTTRVVVPMVICFGIGNSILFVFAADRLVAEQQANQMRRAKTLDRFFHAWEKDVGLMLRSLSLSPAIRSMNQQQASRILSPIYPLTPLRNWRLWEADGSLVSASEQVINIPLQQKRILQDPGFQDARAGRFNFKVSSVQSNGRLDACLQANQPVYGLNDETSVQGILSFCIPLSKLGEDSGLLLVGSESELTQAGAPVGSIEPHVGKYRGHSFFLLNKNGNLVFPVNSGARYSHLSLLSPQRVASSSWAPFVRLARKSVGRDNFRLVEVRGILFYMLVLPVSSEWLSVTVVDRETILAPVMQNLYSLIIAQILTVIVTAVATSFACRRVSRPIKDAGKAIKAISTGDFNAHLDDIYPGELGELYASINQTGGQLRELLEQALAHAVTDQQLETAKTIQKSFIVETLPVVDGIELSAYFLPAYEIGADWFDALAIDNVCYLAVADVCDKGVASALFMSVFRTLVRYGLSKESIHGSSNTPISEVVSLVNNYMAKNHGETLMFATMFLACFASDTGLLHYVSAGHETPLLRKGDHCLRLDAKGPAMGLFQGATYELRDVQLDPGDVLVIFSDGIIDARSPSGDPFGMDRLESMLLAMSDSLTADQIASEIKTNVSEHINDADQFDDMTLMVMRFTKPRVLR